MGSTVPEAVRRAMREIPQWHWWKSPMAAHRGDLDHARQEVNPMRHYRWALVSVPFVVLALLVGALSVMLAMPR